MKRTKTQKESDIVTAVKAWNNGFKEDMGFDPLIEVMAARWREVLYYDDFARLLEGLIRAGKLVEKDRKYRA